MSRVSPLAGCWLLLFGVAVAEARVDRIEILSRTEVLSGKAFGDAGSYEKIIGKVHFKIDPQHARNRGIVDLDKAPRDPDGQVEFASDLYVLQPKDAKRRSGSILMEIPNRGGKAVLRVMESGGGSADPTSEADFGDGFLLRRGVTIVWIGWQFDTRDEPGLMRLYAPVAHDGDRPITGLVRSDWNVNEKTFEAPLGHLINGNIGGTEYPVSDPENAANVLTVRDAPLGERQAISREGWRFTPDKRSVHPNAGFEPGKIYELVYVAKDPVVVGLGLAAVRDLASYFKHAKDSAVTGQRVYALGISQTGRFLRHFLYQGFNADEDDRQVFDGMFVHVAGAGIGSFNHRFSQPSRDAQPTNALFYPTDLFPFADTPQTDAETGQTAGLLDRAKADHVLPKIFYTNTSYEYWSRAASLIHTSLDGKQDLPLMENVRVFFLAGLQHFSGPFPPVLSTHAALPGRYLQNPNPVTWFWRAFFVAMERWVQEEAAPPGSRYPKLADETLVPREKLSFPRIPGVELPARVHEALRLDFGSQWRDGVIAKQPPTVGHPFPMFVPQTDEDGNDRGGVTLPELATPLATYTGWNLRTPPAGMAGERVSFIGSFFPFPKTALDAENAKDPRKSIARRYPTRKRYLEQFSAATDKLIDAGFLLREDAPEIARRGGMEWDFVTK